ncbi:DUF1761 domain-containing protein [Kordia algicida OT-1]|uniref:DUF1761 domain-containing protein n=1 Tax=Kordia algicida OT-1 TaxID=391587 RepID=A9DQN3_9FLAO|nr:DUF1761 domain-containing protein [Kordia algicida]EDP96671.1 hypothetical protein KAOT1_15948 [Kordia algicida OT-1]
MENVNWIALIVAALSTLVIGFLWYGPLFGKAWMKETGITEAQAQKGMPLRFGLSVVLAFFAIFFIYVNSVVTGGIPPDELHGIDVSRYHTFGHGVVHGISVALFIAMPVLVTNALFEQKSFKYMLINVGYWIVTFAIMGGIVNAWV